MIENSWGSGNMNLEAAVPSRAKDQKFMSWLASYHRSGASPKAALQLTKMNTDVDITGILEYIKVPTLLMQRSGDSDVKMEEGTFIAERIKGSIFIELEGNDHLFWVGNTDDILSEMIPFIKGVEPKSAYKKGLITLLFGQISPLSKASYNIEWISNFLNEYGGRILKIDKEHFVVIFDSPGKATLCGTQLLEELKKNNVFSVMGVYMREGHHNSKNNFCDIDRYMINAMHKLSHINQILITQAVKHLLAGADVNFLKTTSILNFQSDKLYDLYTVESSAIKDGDHNPISLEGSKNETFLEQVHQIINQNFEDSDFSVETLTKEIGMSERQLQRKLKEIIGKSPGQLITLIRLNKAKEGLLRHKYTVAEITFLCGFSCPSYFSKCFKKEFGVSPRDITTSS
jgi:AraC-like DNA-binding protein